MVDYFDMGWTTRTAQSRSWRVVAGVAVLAGLYVIQARNYLLFHVLAEFFSIAIAAMIFMVAWNGRRYLERPYLLQLGVAYLAIAALDTLHTVGYAGMGIFRDYDFYANQLWIAARYLESVSLAVAFSQVRRTGTTNGPRLLIVYGVVTAALIYSIFFSDLFPICFVPGVGQTPFKVASEFVIIGILLGSIVAAHRHRNLFDPATFRLLIASVALTILSELAFIFYVDNYGVSNMVGHFAKIISFYLLFRATVHKAISDPYAAIFSQLTAQNGELDRMNRINNDLFSIISHDLRSPFASVRSGIELLDDGWDELTAGDRREVLNGMRATVTNVGDLVDNLLSWAYHERRTEGMRPEELSLSALVEAAIAPHRPAAAAKEIDLALSIDDGCVFVDASTTEVVLRNLISNAVKFTPRGSRVSITGVAGAGSATLTIDDEGPGLERLPSHDAPIESTRGSEGERGTGIGLRLVRRYAAANGIDVRIARAAGAGTRIVLTIPGGGRGTERGPLRTTDRVAPSTPASGDSPV